MLPAENPTAPEAWKPIPEFAGYEASDWGRIRSYWKLVIEAGVKGCVSRLSDEPRILEPKPNRFGRLLVCIRHDSGKILTRQVHRLVLTAFVGPCPPGMEACHFPDRDPTNCRLDNLRWGTLRENRWDAGRHGTLKVLVPEQIAEIGRLIAEGVTGFEIARRFGVGRECICNIAKREGFPTPARRPLYRSVDDDCLAKMIELRKQGLPQKEIVRRLGVPQSTVSRYLAKSAAQLA